MADQAIGGFIAEFRRTQGLSQGAFADRLNIAAGSDRMTRGEVSRWERGTRVPVKYWAGWIAVLIDGSHNPLAGRTDRGDDYSVRLGYELYQKYGRTGITAEQLTQEIRSRINNTDWKSSEKVKDQ